MNQDAFVYAAMAALVLFALYRRFRSVFGRQLLQPTRLKFRIGVLSLVTLLLIARGTHSANLAMAGLAGFAFGAALAYVGLRLTRFDVMPGGIFYTPNAYIGLVLSALLLSRLAYRFKVLYPTMQAAHAETGDPFAAFQRSPLTLALFGIVIGYYLAYCIGLLARGAAMQRQPAQAASPPSGP